MRNENKGDGRSDGGGRGVDMIYVKAWNCRMREVDGTDVKHVLRVKEINGRIKGKVNQTIYDLLMAGF